MQIYEKKCFNASVKIKKYLFVSNLNKQNKNLNIFQKVVLLHSNGLKLNKSYSTMVTSTIRYLGDLKTEATHILSGKKILTEAPPDNQGKGTEFSPTDLCATSLGCCMLTIVGILAKTNNIDIVGAEADVEKIMATDPRRIQNILIKIKMPPNGYSSEQKSIMMKAAYNCPVQKSLGLGLKVELHFVW
jgi:uncharacterized OsmC-like protein